MKRDRRAAAMLEYVVAQIRSCRFGPGSRLPPVARLAAQFDLCYATAYRAMDVLVRDRWLVRDSRGRLLVMPTARRRKQELRILLLLNPDETQQTTIHPVWLDTFMRLCVKWLRKEPCVVSLAVRDASAETIRAAAAGCGGVVYCGSYDRRLVASPVTLPQVGTGMRGFPDGGCTTVNIDPYKAAAAAVDFFTARGCGTVHLFGYDVGHAEPKSAFDFRGRIFAEYWRSRGRLIEHQTPLPDNLDGDGRCDPDHFTDPDAGYLFVSGTRANGAAQEYVKRTGRALCDDFHVLSIDGKSLLRPDYHPINTIATDYPAMGRTTLEECLQRIATPGEGPHRIYQNVYLSLKK